MVEFDVNFSGFHSSQSYSLRHVYCVLLSMHILSNLNQVKINDLNIVAANDSAEWEVVLYTSRY